MGLAETFNRSSFGRFINAPAGRAFRLSAGTAFLAWGLLHRDTWAGWASIAWSTLPLSAGGFDVCYISLWLGGPFSGKKIRSQYGVR